MSGHPRGLVTIICGHVVRVCRVSAVEITGPKASWPSEFAAIADELRRLLGSIASAMDHIGSTSVDRLPAKDVIDVQVTVEDATELAEACELLTAAGYPVNRDGRDHLVPGESEDPECWGKGFANEAPGQRRANIHIRIEGKPNQVYALLFRDYLRANPGTALAYGEFKRRAAKLLSNDSAGK